MTKAAVYCRISLDASGQGLGVERQEQECRAFCEARGWEVVGVYVDNDISATTGKVRPRFEALLSERNGYDVIVVWHTDRLVRLSSDLLRVIDLGANVYAIHAGHLDLSTPAGRAVAKTVTAWAEYEGEQKGLRQKAAHRQRVASGRPWWSTRPFGLTEDGRLYPGEAEAVREAYRAILEGSSLNSVCRRWNNQGFTTARGNTWQSSTLKKFLSNARNAGLIAHGGEVVGRGQWDALVDEMTWRAVCDTLSQRGTARPWIGRPSGRLLVGVATCGTCGGSLASWARPEDQGGPIYRCIGSHCGQAKIVDADAIVLRRLLEELEHPGFRRWWHEHHAPDPDAASKRGELSALSGRLADLAEAYAGGSVDLAMMTSASEKINARMSELRSDLAEDEASRLAFPLADVEGVLETVLEVDLDRQRELLRLVFSEVKMHPRRNGGARDPLVMECGPRVPTDQAAAD